MEAPSKYPSPMRIMHWFMAFLLLAMIALGWRMSELDGEDLMRMKLYELHKSFGVTLLALVLLRLAIRLASALPKLPDGINPFEAKAAKLAYVLFYILMIAIPVSGYSMSTLFGFPVKWFGYELPRLLAVDKILARDVAEWHEIMAYSLLALVIAHVAGAVKHKIKDKINLLPRMW